jgi:hypothetical protein
MLKGLIQMNVQLAQSDALRRNVWEWSLAHPPPSEPMRPTPLFLVVTLTLLTACRHRDDDRRASVHLSRSDAATAPYVMQEGDIRIESVDGGIDLALLGNTISGGLSQKTLQKVKRETDTNEVKSTGFGADIEKMVKGTVQSALGTRVGIPLSDVKDVHYDGQKIVFEWNGKSHHDFGNTKINHKDVLSSFSAAAAQRFVDAVHARKQARSEK